MQKVSERLQLNKNDTKWKVVRKISMVFLQKRKGKKATLPKFLNYHNYCLFPT